MTTKIVVLEQDTTGLAQDNYIQGEVHSPAPGALRIVIPKWGAFFVESLAVYDADTLALVDPIHYIIGDAWEKGQELSGKAVASSFLLKPTAPVDVEITYQAFGGPQSRNAELLVAWLNEHMTAAGASKSFKDLKDVPKEFEPAYHKHLLSHVFGMEYIVGSLDRLRSMLSGDRDNQLQADYETAKARVARMAASADVSVIAMINDFWSKWKDNVSLYALGIDLLKNYPALGAGGAYSAAPAFSVTNEQDERYVDIAGLGAFSKAMADRIVTGATGLGLDLAQEKEAQRGSFIGALVGEVFYLPAPEVARKLDYVNMAVYPKNWPNTHPMVVVKQMGHSGNYGGVFSAFNPVNGNQFIGLLANDTWKTPLVWQRVYHSDETTAIGEALKVHMDGKGAIHEETKEQLGLSRLENLPVVTEDTIVTGETARHMVTLDGLMAFVRVHQEAIKLARDSKGNVDYSDTMDKHRVIINAGACQTTHPPKDQFISSFCDGTDKYVRMSDGNGSYYDKLQENNSNDCGTSTYPPYGTKVSEFCEGTTLKTRYSDGKGNYFTETTTVYSEACGFSKPLALGTVISVFCSGVNQVTRYADGKGASYDLPTQINTYLCGGTIYPSAGGTGGTGGTTAPTVKTLKVASTHTKISKNTTEILSFAVTGLVPNGQYSFDLIVKSPSFASGAEITIYSASFIANASGAYLWEQTRLDDGVTQPRGEYQTWVTIEAANLTSNKIVRTLIADTVAQTPDNPNNAGGGQAGSGGTSTTPPKDVNGDDYGHAGQPWPPVPAYNPAIYFSSDKGTLFVGTNETLRAELRNFYANRSYTLEFWFSHPEVNSGAPMKTLDVQVQTNEMGVAIYSLSQYDDGIVPRGMTQNWIEVKADAATVKSNIVDRQFAAGSDTQSPWRLLKCTTSHATVYINTSYTHAVVLTGGTPNTKYTLEIRRSQYSGLTSESNILINSAVVTTDGTGAARLDYTSTYDGVTPTAKSYQFYARLAGIEQMSTISDVTFVAKPAVQSDRARIAFSSTHSVLRKGVTETLTATLTNFPVNTTVQVEFWNQGASLNNGQDYRSYTGSVRTGSDGTGTLSVTAFDDGTTVPRGDYSCWVVAVEPNSTSNRISRTFMLEIGTLPGNNSNVQVNYSSSHSTITPGVRETHSLVVTGLTPGSNNEAKFFIASPALNNGMTPLMVLSVQLSANSAGRGEYSFVNTDDGVTSPRGTYTCWVECAGAKSPNITRVFTGTPPPSVPYNPKIVYSKSNLTLSVGTTDNNGVNLTGMKANTSYAVDVYMQGPNAFGGQAYRTIQIQIITDANGAGSWTQNGTDTGVIPRGTYSLWAEIPSLNLTSNVLTGTWMGTPAPTEPPFNPSVRYYTDRSYLTVGTPENHTIVITGMRARTTYSVTLWAQSPVLWGGAASAMKTVSITTDANGWGQYGFSNSDDGLAPRGSYANWAVIDGLNVSSSVFTRVFA